MNNLKRKTLVLALMQAMTDGSDTGGNTQDKPATDTAPAVETIEKMPQDARNPSGPVGRSYAPLGEERATKILGAEQGLAAAEQTVAQTRLDGALEICNLHEPNDRLTYIQGMRNALERADGGTISQNHRNLEGEYRRIHSYLEKGEGDLKARIQQAKDWLNGKGTYPEKMKNFPRTGNRGGKNLGQGQSALQKAAVDTAISALKASGIEQPTADQVKEQLAKMAPQPAQQPQPGTTIEPSKGDQAAAGQPDKRTSTQPEKTVRELQQTMEFLHANQLEPVGVAFANRCQLDPQYKDLGRLILQWIDGQSETAEQRAAREQATNDVQRQQPQQETQPMAH